MSENVYLTKSEQEVFNLLSRSNIWIITSEQIKDIFFHKDPKKINKIISSLKKKGYLYRLKRENYLIQEIPTEKPIIKDPYLVGLALFKGYLAFSSALKIYDLIDYEPFMIFIATWNISRTEEIGNYLIKAVALGEKAIGITHYKNYYVSTREKTIYDCLIKPQFAGGYATITQAIYRIGELNWEVILGYIEKFSSNSMAQKIGYILDLLNTETNIEIPKQILQSLRRKVKTNTKLLAIQGSKGEYNKKWRVVDNIGKNRILSWWYYG